MYALGQRGSQSIESNAIVHVTNNFLADYSKHSNNIPFIYIPFVYIIIMSFEIYFINKVLEG